MAVEEIEVLEPTLNDEFEHPDHDITSPDGIEVPKERIFVDHDSMTLVDMETGEVLGIADVPPEGLNDVAYAEWLAERALYHKGRANALKAEKDTWLKDITERYDAKIRRHEGTVKWIKRSNWEFLKNLCAKMIAGRKERSVQIGFFKLAFTRSRASLEVADNEKGVAWLRNRRKLVMDELAKLEEQHPDPDTETKAQIANLDVRAEELKQAIKVVRTVAKSNVPDWCKDEIKDEDALAETGMCWHPGGDDVFDIKD